LKGGRIKDCDGTNHRQKQLIKLCREGNWDGGDEKGFGREVEEEERRRDVLVDGVRGA
jgi:hypothetical protein